VTYDPIIAQAAVSTVLKQRNVLTHKQVAQYLMKAAALDPEAIPNAIAKLKAEIELLEAYMPAREEPRP
jgi:replication initiation and membrane attachment protein DnaB